MFGVRQSSKTGVALFVAIAIVPVFLGAQQTGTTTVPSRADQSILNSYVSARRLLDAAVLAHGGPAALQRAQRLRVMLDGEDVWRNQSRRVAPPYDRRPAQVDLMIDVPASRLSYRTAGTYPGDLANNARLVVDSQRAHRVMESVGQHRVDRPSDVATNAVSLNIVPQLLLAQAATRTRSLRAIGQLRLSSGAMVNGVTFGMSDGSVMTIGFDTRTGLLRAIVAVLSDPLTGDAAMEIEFVDYRRLDGLLLPSRRITSVAGEVTQELHYRTATVNYAIPESSLAIPAGSVPLDRTAPAERVRQLAPGVFQIWLFGVWITAAVVADYAVVFEAPRGSVAEVTAQLAKVAPGKPVRYVVLTHHHDDHSGGVNEYAAAGATIVTTPGNRAYVERMAKARITVAAEVPTAPASTVRIETIAAGARRTFTDGAMTVEVHSAPANEHVEEMLVGWIPAIGAVLEGDMINLAPNGTVPTGANFAAFRAFVTWLRTRDWDVRNFLSMHHSMTPASVLDEISRQPVRP